MTLVTTTRMAAVGIILVAALLSLLLVFTLRGGSHDKFGSFFPGITLATEAEAAALAQAVPALNTEKVGLLAHLDLDIDGANPFQLQPGTGDNPGFLNTVREHLVGTSGIGSVVVLQDNFVIATWCVKNRTGCITVNLFVDSTGNIVAYLSRGAPSARIWQAQSLDTQAPQLTNANFDTNLVGGALAPGGLKEVLGLFGTGTSPQIPGGLDAVIPGTQTKLREKITWFHFGHPLAYRLLMIGKAFGQPSVQTINIALPPAVQAGIVEVSFQAYGVDGDCCHDALLRLDGTQLYRDSDLRGDSLSSGFVDLGKFKTTQAHAMQLELEPTTGKSGSTGAALLILYDVP